MERLCTLSQSELPDHLRWQAVSFLRIVWPDIDDGHLRATYPPSLDPVHHLVVDDGLLLAYAATFVQELEVGGTAVRVGCLGNVLTFPGSRRRGHGRAVVGAATRHLQGGDADLGALLCDPGLTGFYAVAGWLPAGGPTLVEDPDGGEPAVVDALRMVLPVSARGRALEQPARDGPLRVPFPW